MSGPSESTLHTLSSCVGTSVERAAVIEMGLYGPDEAPAFTHPDLKFVQALMLELSLSDGRLVRIETWQDDDQFALSGNVVGPEQGVSLGAEAMGSLYRERALDEFPRGLIGDVKWTFDERANIQEVSLIINGQTAHLKAGEVYENLDGRIVVRDRDESVLIFTTDEAFQSTVFNEAAYAAP